MCTINRNLVLSHSLHRSLSLQHLDLIVLLRLIVRNSWLLTPKNTQKKDYNTSWYFSHLSATSKTKYATSYHSSFNTHLTRNTSTDPTLKLSIICSPHYTQTPSSIKTTWLNIMITCAILTPHTTNNSTTINNSTHHSTQTNIQQYRTTILTQTSNKTSKRYSPCLNY